MGYDAGRVRKDHWKGMTEAEKKAIIAEQAAQVMPASRLLLMSTVLSTRT